MVVRGGGCFLMSEVPRQVLGDSNEALPKFRELSPLRSFDILYTTFRPNL